MMTPSSLAVESARARKMSESETKEGVLLSGSLEKVKMNRERTRMNRERTKMNRQRAILDGQRDILNRALYFLNRERAKMNE